MWCVCVGGCTCVLSGAPHAGSECAPSQTDTVQIATPMIVRTADLTCVQFYREDKPKRVMAKRAEKCRKEKKKKFTGKSCSIDKPVKRRGFKNLGELQAAVEDLKKSTGCGETEALC